MFIFQFVILRVLLVKPLNYYGHENRYPMTPSLSELAYGGWAAKELTEKGLKTLVWKEAPWFATLKIILQ